MAGLALDDVAAVARVPGEAVVARAQERHVGTLVAVGDVVAVAADQGLGAAATDEIVVAVTAVERLGAAADQRVVAALAVDLRGRGGGERAVGLVDAQAIVAASAVDADAADVVARDPEVGGPVVADVDFEDLPVRGALPERDPVAGCGALDDQHLMPDLDLDGRGGVGRRRAHGEGAGEQPGRERGCHESRYGAAGTAVRREGCGETVHLNGLRVEMVRSKSFDAPDRASFRHAALAAPAGSALSFFQVYVAPTAARR